MIVQLVRFVLLTAGALGGFAISGLVDWSEEIGFPESLVIMILVILGSAMGFLLGGIIGRELTRGYEFIEERIKDLAVSDLVLGTVGLFAGLVIALIVSYPLRLLHPQWIAFVAVSLMFVLAAYAGVRIALLKSADFARSLGSALRGRASEDSVPPVGAPLKLLDTSAVIDGRFAELLRRSFLEGRVVVPAFVVSELQTLADSADDLRRARGRRGLDMLDTLRGGARPVEVFTSEYADIPDVDSKLLRLAEDTGGAIITVDFNLTKVARIQGIDVLNVNELATALRPNVMAGDSLTVAILKPGKEPGQGVGYLQDGTMVVVEDADDDVGREIEATVSSLFQASAGRMVFARKRGGP